MERAAGEFRTIHEAVVFLDYFRDLPDPRRLGKVTYPLGEVLLLCLPAVLGGAETRSSISRGRREGDRPFPPVPAVSRWNAFTQSPPKLSRQSPAAALHSARQVAASA
jgi:hypothetical protein